MALSRSDTEIGRDLLLAEATVETHVDRVLAALGARDGAHRRTTPDCSWEMSALAIIASVP